MLPQIALTTTRMGTSAAGPRYLAADSIANKPIINHRIYHVCALGEPRKSCLAHPPKAPIRQRSAANTRNLRSKDGL